MHHRQVALELALLSFSQLLLATRLSTLCSGKSTAVVSRHNTLSLMQADIQPGQRQEHHAVKNNLAFPPEESPLHAMQVWALMVIMALPHIQHMNNAGRCSAEPISDLGRAVSPLQLNRLSQVSGYQRSSAADLGADASAQRQ